MIWRVVRSWRARASVAGQSMAPGLVPDDWVLIDPDAYRQRSPVAGDLIVTPDPREPERVLIKRVTSVQGDGRLMLGGDSPRSSTDSRTFGPITAAVVTGRPWFRYWPLRRIGPLR